MRQQFTTLQIGWKGYWFTLAMLGLVLLAGLVAARYMEHNGHWVTGMSNQIVWGMPHVFAILLIVAASGALNVASMGSVFGISRYKPLARLSGLLAVAFLIGGLLVLVLDLGRPDRLIVAMTSYNFKSIFAWNIFLYTGFVFIAMVYLWMLFEPRMGRFSRPVGPVRVPVALRIDYRNRLHIRVSGCAGRLRCGHHGAPVRGDVPGRGHGDVPAGDHGDFPVERRSPWKVSGSNGCAH